MKPVLKIIVFSLVAIFGVFLVLELLSRPFLSPGAKSYIERRILEQKLPRVKPSNEYWIFLYGESTMHGCLLFPESTIDRWIEIYLNALLPADIAKRVRVANFARLGEESGFIAESFLDTRYFHPDFVAFYTAHNDFTQTDNRRRILRLSPLERLASKARSLIKRSFFLSELIRQSVRLRLKKHKGTNEKDPPEFHEQLRRRYDPEKDLLSPNSDEKARLAVYWKHNIQRILAAAQSEHVPLLFFSPLANYKEFPPYESRHLKPLSTQDQTAWERLWFQCNAALNAKSPGGALPALERLAKLDPNYAIVHYRLGQVLELSGQFSRAKEHYLLANEWDFFPARAPLLVTQYYQTLKQQNLKDVFIVPTQEVFETASSHGIVDHELVNDTMHPNIRGQALMALEIVRVIYQNGFFAKDAPWDWEHLPSFEELKAQLNLSEEFWFRYYLALGGQYLGRQYEERLRYSRLAWEMRPESAIAQRQLAWIYWKTGHLDEARKLYRNLLKERPQEIQAMLEKNPALKSFLTENSQSKES